MLGVAEWLGTRLWIAARGFDSRRLTSGVWVRDVIRAPHPSLLGSRQWCWCRLQSGVPSVRLRPTLPNMLASSNSRTLVFQTGNAGATPAARTNFSLLPLDEDMGLRIPLGRFDSCEEHQSCCCRLTGRTRRCQR